MNIFNIWIIIPAIKMKREKNDNYSNKIPGN